MRVELRDLGKAYDGERWAVRGLTQSTQLPVLDPRRALVALDSA